MKKNSNPKPNFIVCKSSAGSGKTFTLVKSYLTIALSDNSHRPFLFKKILAITFTNKAAAEMKERILKTLREISSGELQKGNKNMADVLQDELDISFEEIQQRGQRLLKEILHHYADFSVSTIDSFVHKIIRAFAFDLGLPLNFAIETDEKEIINQCVDRIVSKAGVDVEITDLLRSYTRTKVNENKNWQVDLEIKSFLTQILNEVTREKLQQLSELTINDFKKIRFNLNQKKKKFENELIQLSEKAFTLLQKNDLKISDIYFGAAGIMSFFRKLEQKEFNDKKLSHLEPHSNNNIKKTLEKKGAWTSEKKDIAKIEKISSIQLELEKLYFAGLDSLNQGLSDYNLISAIEKEIYALSLLNEAEKEIEEIKKEKNILFLSEFNQRISKLVIEEPAPFIYERMGEKYHYFLIDEFQDTSVTQWLNLLPLVINSLSQGHSNLLVGDGKQSIYRWRGGETRQFVELPELNSLPDFLFKNEWTNNLKNNYTENVLATNFRSYSEIVRFNNLFFDQRILFLNLDICKSTYEKQAQKWQADKEGGLITLDILPYKKNHENIDAFERVIRYIKESLEDGYSLKDICLIIRKNETGRQCANYLTRRGIPVISSESLWLDNSTECNFIIQFLRFIVNPQDQISFISTIHYCKEFDLITPNREKEILREAKLRKFNLMELIEDTLKSVGIDIELKTIQSMPILDACIFLVQLFNLENKNSLYIPFFLEACFEYSHRNGNSISDFIIWWDEKGFKKSVISPPGSEAVKILSIHASKGLEFPIVILPAMDWKIKNEDHLILDTTNAIVGEDLPISLVKNNKLIQGTHYAQEGERDFQKQYLDNLNLVYVAFTRAEQRLHILSTEKGNHDECLTDWIKEFIENSELEINQEGTAVIGKRQKKNETNSKQESNYFSELNFEFRHWKETINIKQSTNFGKESNSKRERGILLHKILAKIQSKESIQQATEFAVKQGIIKSSEKELYLNLIKEVISHPKISLHYEKGIQAFNEKSILDNDGKTYRVDRIIFNSEQTVLIDFKFGKEKNEHKEQLDQYRNLLLKSGQKEVKNLLYYVDSQSIYEF